MARLHLDGAGQLCKLTVLVWSKPWEEEKNTVYVKITIGAYHKNIECRRKVSGIHLERQDGTQMAELEQKRREKATRNLCCNLACCMLSLVCGRLQRCGSKCRREDGQMEEFYKRPIGKTCRRAQKLQMHLVQQKEQTLETCRGSVKDTNGSQDSTENQHTLEREEKFLGGHGKLTLMDHHVFFQKKGLHSKRTTCERKGKSKETQQKHLERGYELPDGKRKEKQQRILFRRTTD